MGWLSACRTLAYMHGAKRVFDRQKARPELTYLFWETTLGCNLACRHCGSRCAPDVARRDDLPGVEVKRVFSELAQDLDASRVTVAVTGGEPLTRADVFDVMAHARKLGFRWGMVTNGVLVTEATLRQMERAGMETVTVSVDGDAEGHAFLRGSLEAYEGAMRGLRLLAKAPFISVAQATTVVHRRNLDLLPRMYDTLLAAGAKEWRLLMADPIGRMRDPENRELILTGPDLACLLDFVAERRAAGPLEVTFEESGFLGLEYEGRVRDYYFHCPAGIYVGSILHDGAIGACPSLERTLVEGNARTERFSTVWNQRFQRYRDRDGTRRRGPCASCAWWRYCEGGSLHLWDFEAEAPRLCHYRLMKEAGCL